MGEILTGESSENAESQYRRLYQQVEEKLALFEELIKQAMEPGQPLPYNQMLYREAVNMISTARFHESRGNWELATEMIRSILDKLTQAQTPTSAK